jgi:antitoxin (DNA-binding transcriptional repressor) of toxin-antitoxin stability system
MEEYPVEEFQNNFDELFERVENGETFVIVHPEGQKVLIMPADQLPYV